MIKELAASGQRVNELCDLFGISASGYYDWLNREPSERERTDKVLAENIKEIHKESRKSDGSPRITKALRQKGVKCGKKRTARIMKQNGLKGAQKARYRPRTTDIEKN